MAKLFKGLGAKSDFGNFSNVSLERQAATLVQPAHTLLAPDSVATDFSIGAAIAATFAETQGSTAADDVELVGKVFPEFTVLDCLSDKGLQLQAGLSNYIAHNIQTSSAVSVPSTIMDEGTLNVIVGGSVSGVLDNAADHDTASVFLVAGQVYFISVRGTGANPTEDSFINIFDPSAVNIGHDDDGGNDLNSMITITAAVTGNYSIDISSANPAANVGGYTVDVRVQGVDAVGDTNATSVVLSEGTTFGFRETATVSGGADLDRYQVTLEAGKFYTFKLAAGADYETNYTAVPAGEIDTILRLRNSGGTLLAQNDDNSFPSDISSGFGFYATVSGTYYLDVTGYSGQTGGYGIDFHEVNYQALDPLDSINWMSADNIDTVLVSSVPTAYVYFGAAGETFGEAGLVTYGWNATEKAAVMSALLEFTKITGITYVETADVNQAEFRLNTVSTGNFGAYFYPQDPAFGTQEGIGIFNVNSGGWDKPGVSTQDIPGNQVSLDKGGFAYAVILHELGHGHGLAHPHDNGGGSDVMVGVTAPTNSYGIFNLDQGVYTVMSYNDAWDFFPDGPSPFTIAGIGNGWSGTLSAFDIAELQIRYGVHANNGGDNVYTLASVQQTGVYYECIWDSGGTDSIVYSSTGNARIDLTAATLDYSPVGAGALSFVDQVPGTAGADGIWGGFTIANGVVIENATGGSGNDTLIGNGVANELTGNNGTDTFIGRGGDDIIHGGAGTDTARYDGNRADYTIQIVRTNGVITGFTVTDTNTAAPADSNNPVTVANEGTDTLDGVETLQFADAAFSLSGAVAVFDASDNLVSVHTTIQAAIDAVTTLDGYKIIVSGGTYAEDVNVTKDLTILGANDGVAGTDPGRFGETAIQSLVISANGVTIDGVSVTGSITYPGAGFPSGIYVIGNNFSLVNSVLDGPSSATGILTQSVTGLDIGDNLIEGYGRGGYVSGDNTSGAVHDNQFQGDGAGSGTGLQNGIYLETSHVTLDGNTFDGIDGGSIFFNPHGPNPVDLETIILNTTITDSGVDRPIQVLATAQTPHMLGTDFNEAFYDPFYGTASEIAVGLSFDGRGGDDYIYGNIVNGASDDFSGGAGSDQIFAGAGDDLMNGGADDDLLDGEAGIDTAVFADNTLNYTSTLIGWLVGSSEGNDFLQRTEIAIDGTGQRNLLVGGTAFADIQAAFNAAEAGDIVRLAAGNYSGTSTYSDAGLLVLAQNGAHLNVTFSTAGTNGISVYGNTGVDHITTGAGSDTLSGGAGADVLAGGAGDDTYYVDNAGDQAVEANGEGRDVVYASASYALTAGSSIEVLSAASIADTNALNLTGNELAQEIYGNNGANTFIGGGGADYVAGYGGDDTYYVSSGLETFVENAGQGRDVVYSSQNYALTAGSSIEVLSTTSIGDTTALTLVGNEFGQEIYGNNGANVLIGGGGADYMAGFGGDDIYYVQSGTEVIAENIGQGRDVVYSSQSSALTAGASIEVLSAATVGDTNAINLTGNELAQEIYGNNGGNVLNGLGGNDFLQGFGGADTFAFTTALGAGNVDTVADFVSGTDKISLDDAVFTQIGGLGALNPNAFFAGSAAHDADDRIIYDVATGNLYYDADGNGAGAEVLFANLQGYPPLVASDFVVI